MTVIRLQSVGILLFSGWVMSNSLQSHGLQHARLPCPSLSPRVCSNSCPWIQGWHPTISSSVAPFSSCPLSFPASGSQYILCQTLSPFVDCLVSLNNSPSFFLCLILYSSFFLILSNIFTVSVFLLPNSPTVYFHHSIWNHQILFLRKLLLKLKYLLLPNSPKFPCVLLWYVCVCVYGFFVFLGRMLDVRSNLLIF